MVRTIVALLFLAAAAASALAGDALVADTHRLELPDGYAPTQEPVLRTAATTHASALCAAAGYRVAAAGEVTLYAKGNLASPVSLLVAVRLDAEGPVASVAAIPPEWLAQVSRGPTGAEGTAARKVLVGTRGAVPAVEVRGSFDRGDHSPNPARSLIVPRRDFVLVVTLEGVSAVGSGESEPEGSPWAVVLGSLEVLAPSPTQSSGKPRFPMILVAGGAVGLLLLVGLVVVTRRRERPVPVRPSSSASASGSGAVRAVDGLPTFARAAQEPPPPPPPSPAPAEPRPSAPAAAKPAAAPRTGPLRITGNGPLLEGASGGAPAPERTAKISRNTDFLNG